MSISQVDAFWSPNELSAIRGALEDLQQQACQSQFLKAKKLWKIRYSPEASFHCHVCNYWSAPAFSVLTHRTVSKQ